MSLSQEIEANLKYLSLLSDKFPNIASASTEIINLQAILNLPKGTEHYLTDIHGEYESFIHILKNASGVIKQKIKAIFGSSLSSSEINKLATLIYYPEQKLDLILKEEVNKNEWYRITLYRLIEICRNVSSKYTRSKVRKALPKDFAYIIEELLHEQQNSINKIEYYDQIITSIINVDRAREFIIALSQLIQRLVIDRLHILGDIYDRGPGAEIILDKLLDYHSVDIQWGNHDILWIGACSGSTACVATAVRISTRYGNLETIENGYGINLLPLATFALDYYGDDPCTEFRPKLDNNKTYSVKEIDLIAKMHKAISIIQFKLEGEIIKRRPEFNMEDRLILDKIDYEKGLVTVYGQTYPLLDSNFPTIDPNDPFRLIPDEIKLIKKLRSSFINSDKLNRHIRFFFTNGSLYLNYNSKLLYHGCIPLDEDGNFKKIKLDNKEYSGKELLDYFEAVLREEYFNKYKDDDKDYRDDIMWFLWTGPHSPLFGKDKMTTFERYFIADKLTHKENKNPYYFYWDNEEVCKKILKEFNLNPEKAIIVNGHMPVETKKGQTPIKANGRLLVIDGGFSKAYQSKTGLAGYTLIYNSRGLKLVTHQPFESIENAINEETDILSSVEILEQSPIRIRVENTDTGEDLRNQINDLNQLLYAYRTGMIPEKK